MAEVYLGQIIMTGFGFASRWTALCNGQVMAINQNSALYSLLGTQYGGNGTTSFALPNLQGRTPMGAGPLAPIGSIMGVEQVTLLSSEMPSHTHSLSATTEVGAGRTLLQSRVAQSSEGGVGYAQPGTMVGLSHTDMEGGQLPHTNMQPFNVISFCIALQGIYPSRN